jgi:hypothetical protein
LKHFLKIKLKAWKQSDERKLKKPSDLKKKENEKEIERTS